MAMTNHKRSVKISVQFLVLLSLVLCAPTHQAFGRSVYKTGLVAVRSLVMGPNGAPIFAEYDEEGKVVTEIGEALGDYEDALPVSGDFYRSYLQAYENAVQQLIDTYGQALADTVLIYTKDEYNSLADLGTVQGVTVPKPGLTSENTVSVMVKSVELMELYWDAAGQDPNNLAPVILEAQIDLRDGYRKDLDQDVKSVLLNEQGQILYESNWNIGLRTAFYKNEEGGDLGSKWDTLDKRGNLYLPTGESGRAWTAWGPVEGAHVYDGMNKESSVITGPEGSYAVKVDLPYFGYIYSWDSYLEVELQYENFNPKVKQPWGSYVIARKSRSDSIYQDLLVDAFMLQGAGTLAGLPIGNTRYQYNAPTFEDYAPTNFDFNGDGINDTVVEKINPETQEVEEIQVYFDPVGFDEFGNPTRDPDFTRLPDQKADFQDQGLLESISEADLADTDLYIYRASSDLLIVKREGLRDLEYQQEPGAVANSFKYQMIIHGYATQRLDGGLQYKGHLVQPFSFGHYEMESDYFLERALAAGKALGMENTIRGPRTGDYLRVGEQIRIVIINRKTGYIGTAYTEVKGTGEGGQLDFVVPPIYLSPPNLSIKVERSYEVGEGLTRGEQRNYLVGFEGSGLTSDETVVVTSEWVDQDGTPLPADLEGYTGRLAKVVAANKLGETGQVAQFDIKPGRHMQLVRLPQGIDTEHFYIHINGQPKERNPDFSTIGAGAGPLQYRPQNYVPFKVAIFDEWYSREFEKTAKEQDQNIDTDIHRWFYRPEMQFSLFDLKMNEIQRDYTDAQGQTQIVDILESDIPGISYQDNFVNLFYDLFESDLPPLEAFGPGRELVFTVGEQEISATVGQDQTLIFDNLTHLAFLDPDDYLAIRLYQNSDSSNVLWEYAFQEGLVVGNPFILRRIYQQAGRFDSPLSGLISADYTDDYKILDFNLQQSSEVTLTLLDSDRNEKIVLIPATSLNPGNFNFVLDHQTVRANGINPLTSPNYYVQLEAVPDDGSSTQTILYPGRLRQAVSAGNLGQVMVHDVLIQDGSLNLSRQDIVLKGRGPELSFTRNYNNKSTLRSKSILGTGWSHNLDMKLWPISQQPIEQGAIPTWVSDKLGTFFRPDEIPNTLASWTTVNVNGTTFKKYLGVWYPERGHHGTLQTTGGAFIYTSKDGTRYTYDYPVTSKETPIRTITDRNGNTLTFSYNTADRLESVTDSAGRTLTFGYYENMAAVMGDESSRLANVTGPDGISLVFNYNEEGLLQSAKRGSRVETYEYEKETGILGGDYNLVSATDSNGNTYTYQYHAAGDLDPNMDTYVQALKDQDVIKSVRYPDSSVQYPDSNTAQFQYDMATANKRIVTDLRGNDTTYTLNYFGNPIQIDEPLGKTTLMTWSIDESKPDNVMTSKTDGRNNTTTYEYDAKGNITKETDPYMNSITTVWNQQYSLPESRTDRNGVIQSWNYDANGNLQSHTDGDTKQTIYTYYATGERKSMTDPRSNTTNYTYDTYGNPDKVTEPEGSITDYDHDIRGRRVAVIDGNGNTTQYTYDNLDYPKSIIHPEITAYTLAGGSTNTQNFSYDPEGNLLSETDRNGLTLTYTYTARDQVKTITRNTGGTKTFTYDENGNLTSETDWKGNATGHTYNTLNQRVTTTNRLGYGMAMTYDLEGNLTQITDYQGRVTDYQYDSLNRLTKTTEPALDGSTRGEIINTYYNEADPETNLKSITDQEGNTTTFEYNGRYLRTRQINALNDSYIQAYDDSGNLITETDEEANVTTYQYDNQNRRTLMTQPGAIQTQYSYDLNGNQTEITDPRGKITRIDYDKWNRAFKVTDPDNYTTLTEYDGQGNQVKVTDGNGNSRTWTRDPRGLVTAAVDGEGGTTRYTYNLNDNVETVTDPRGTVTQITYDNQDRPLITTEAVGTAEERTKEVVSYDKMGNPLQVKDGNGNITVTEYNALNLPSKVYDPAPFNAQYTETTYYKTGKVKSVRDRKGNTTAYEYDALNRVTLVTDPLLQTIATTYDRVGNTKTVTDKRGIITQNTYDALYRLIQTDRAGQRLVTNEYDGNSNLTAVIDANNNRIEQTYNNRNLLDTTTNPDTTTQTRTYDGVGNLLTLTDEEGKVTTYTYDRENRETSMELAGEKTQKAYDQAGNLTATTRPKGNSRTMQYDPLNRLTQVTEGGLTTRFEYDKNDNLRNQYDSQNNRVEYTYDALNRKTSHIQYKASGNLVTQFTQYDAEGNLTAMTDPMGRQFTYAYDALDRQTDIYNPTTGSPYYETTQVHNDYDANNNVTTTTETKTGAAGSLTDTTVNTYDNFDRLETSTQRGLTITYTYDLNGNRTGVTSPNGATTYTFDNRNRLQTATAGANITTYTYTNDSKKDTVTYPNGTDVKYTYYPTNRIETVTNKVTATSAVISSYAYQYDQNGNRTNQTETQNGTQETTAYTYDTNDRLASFTITDGTNTTVNQYTFEGYNRKTETVTENGTTTKSRTYTYDQTDWLTEIVDDTDAFNTYTITYTYDNNGNTILKSDSSQPANDTTFTYDARNQLVQTTQSAATLGQYDYNAQGLRVRHRLSERGDVDYYYDDNAVIEEHNATDDSLLAHYRYADRLLSLDTGTSTQYYHHDALGSTVNLTDDTGATQVSYKLDPWGHIRSQTGTSINRQIFTGQEHDENTGLIYFGARYYDPDTARFLTQDTYLGQPGTPPSLHRYLYAYSNPTVYVDLYGFESVIPYIMDEKPLDVLEWGKGEFTDEAGRFADDLSEEETGYLEYFKFDRTDSGNLSEDQTKRASELFGDREDANALYANWKDRAQIINHYKITHPATIDALMGLYRLSRDINPLHFAIERGWQVGRGKEMYTGQEVSRKRALAEFVTGLAFIKATNVAVAKTRPGLTVEPAVKAAPRVPKPRDNYSPAWEKYYQQNPREVRAVGADAYKGKAPNTYSPKGSGQKYYRYIGEAEAKIIRRTGKIPNVDKAGNPKDVYFTNRLYETAGRAKTHNQLPNKPVYRVEIDPAKVPNRTPFTRVNPSDNPKLGIGRGVEATTRDAIPVDPSTLIRLKGAGL